MADKWLPRLGTVADLMEQLRNLDPDMLVCGISGDEARMVFEDLNLYVADEWNDSLPIGTPYVQIHFGMDMKPRPLPIEHRYLCDLCGFSQMTTAEIMSCRVCTHRPLMKKVEEETECQK